MFITRISEKAKNTKDKLIEIGYPAYTVEDFQETVSDLIKIGH